MSISFQTNVSSIDAQNNLRINESLQNNTIQQLTSGYRINNSGDDAAGLAIANGLRDNIAELTQGVGNANNGVAQLQIIDGGLSNISTILDRLKTLATESASGTFTGDRNTLNQEYTGLISEINRQAANINLNQGGSFNQNLSVYIGGASNAADANVNVDLSGNANAVDATSLGLANTSIAGSGGGVSGNALNLTAADASGQTFLKGSTGNQTFDFYTAGTNTPVAVTLTATSTGYTLSQALSNINAQLGANTNTAGITASVDGSGHLQFTGSAAFTVKDQGLSAATATNALTDYTAFKAAAGYVTGSEGQGANSTNYTLNGGAYVATTAANTDKLTFTTSAGASINLTLDNTNGNTLTAAISAINAVTSKYGIYATSNADNTGIAFQSSSAFSVNDQQGGAGNTGAFSSSLDTATAGVSYTPTAPGASTNGASAIAAINAAIQALGLVQGSVGAGENKLQYAINLAQSQIANFSTAQSQIRDADVAAEAANLTKSQVLQQSSIAALAQANAEPQALLKLLQ